jgi:hypothetical protein
MASLICFVAYIKILSLLRSRRLSHWPVVQLILMLCELLPPKVAQMFCLLDPACEKLPKLFQRSGGALSAMTTCCPLFTLNKPSYFLAFNFWFGSTFLALLFLSFRL